MKRLTIFLSWGLIFVIFTSVNYANISLPQLIARRIQEKAQMQTQKKLIEVQRDFSRALLRMQKKIYNNFYSLPERQSFYKELYDAWSEIVKKKLGELGTVESYSHRDLYPGQKVQCRSNDIIEDIRTSYVSNTTDNSQGFSTYVNVIKNGLVCSNQDNFKLDVEFSAAYHACVPYLLTPRRISECQQAIEKNLNIAIQEKNAFKEFLKEMEISKNHCTSKYKDLNELLQVYGFKLKKTLDDYNLYFDYEDQQQWKEQFQKNHELYPKIMKKLSFADKCTTWISLPYMSLQTHRQIWCKGDVKLDILVALDGNTTNVNVSMHHNASCTFSSTDTKAAIPTIVTCVQKALLLVEQSKK